MITKSSKNRQGISYRGKYYHCFYSGSTLDIRELRAYDKAGNRQTGLERDPLFTGTLMSTLMQEKR